ncbi:D-xylose transporter [Folsomia candida]|uniref:Protein spinster 2 n=1 Tax=Folsomia candida TaxID=158441 RepID=A0A226ERH1_FOLCA|nr:D-xylose transporter [Folsomia candida]XP_021945489.1 D-xylose transporter [Folsomia candida]OXA59747.1 Protein spinster 2 [Folsomia candida]
MPISSRLSSEPLNVFTSKNWLLFLVAAIHLSAALSHFLLSVVSKYVSRDIHYGDQACVPATDSNATLAMCSVAKSNETCQSISSSEGNTCIWDYTGLGLDYQLLAGPSFMAVFTTTSILWGLAADRFNRINLLVWCSSVFSLATILTAFATKFWHLVILRMILAAGVAGIGPICPGIIFDAFPEKHRALAMGFFHWGIYLGGGLSNAIGKTVTDLHIFVQGWRGTFLSAGIPGIILGLLVFLTGKDPPRIHKGHEQDFHSHMHHGHATSGCPPPKTNNRTLNNMHVQEEDDEDQEDVIEYETCEAQVLIEQHHVKYQTANAIPFSLWKCCLEPPVLMLGIGACIRQAAGYTWGYNSALYYQTYYPNFDASWWLTWITIFGGSIGVIFGGFVSDILVSRLGLSARALVLAVSQVVAFPFALATLCYDPPISFFALLIGYFFAEMWYGVVFAILVELLPHEIRSLGMAVALFAINNFGGNVPVIISPLSNALSYRTALIYLYPGSLLLSSFLFFMGYLSISK